MNLTRIIKFVLMTFFGIILIIQYINSPVSGNIALTGLLYDTNPLNKSITDNSNSLSDVSQIYEGDFTHELLSQDLDMDGFNDTIELRTSLKYQYNGVREFFYLNLFVSLTYWNTTDSEWQYPDDYPTALATSLMYITDPSIDKYNESYFLPLPLNGDYQLNMTGNIETLDLFDTSTIWSNMNSYDLGLELSISEEDWDSNGYQDTMIMEFEFKYNRTEIGKDLLIFGLSMIVEYWDINNLRNSFHEVINLQIDLVQNPTGVYSLRTFWNAPFDGNFTFDLRLSNGEVTLWEGIHNWESGDKYVPDYPMWLGNFGTDQAIDADSDGLTDTTTVRFSGGVDYASSEGLTIAFDFLLRIYEWSSITDEWIFLKFDNDNRLITINSTNSYPKYEFLFRAPAANSYKFEMIFTVDGDKVYSNIHTWVPESAYTGLFYDWDYKTWWVDDDSDGGVDTFYAVVDLLLDKAGAIEFTVYVDIYVQDIRDVIVESEVIAVSFNLANPGWYTQSISWVSKIEPNNNWFIHMYFKNQENITILDMSEISSMNYDDDAWIGWGVDLHNDYISTDPNTTDPNNTDPSNTDPPNDSESSSPIPFASIFISLISLISVVYLISSRKIRK